jgi:hypothetical protein
MVVADSILVLTVLEVEEKAALVLMPTITVMVALVVLEQIRSVLGRLQLALE